MKKKIRQSIALVPLSQRSVKLARGYYFSYSRRFSDDRQTAHKQSKPPALLRQMEFCQASAGLNETGFIIWLVLKDATRLDQILMNKATTRNRLVLMRIVGLAFGEKVISLVHGKGLSSLSIVFM